MATKKESEAAAKKRKGATAAPTGVDAEGKTLGIVSIHIQTAVNIPGTGQFNELVIEWSCLGLSEEPDSIADTSGNAKLLDPKRAPRTDEAGLHVYFDPPLPAGSYGFNFLFTYNDAVSAGTHAEPTDEERQKEQTKKPAEAA